MFSLREYRQPTHRLPDLLPWAALIDTGVVLQKDGLIQKTLAFRGPDLASSSPSELVAGVARLNNALRRFGSGWTLYVEAQRTIASGYPKSDLVEPRRVSCRRRAPRELPAARAPASSRTTTSPSSGRRPRSARRAPRLSSTRTPTTKAAQTSLGAIWRPSRRPSPSSPTSWPASSPRSASSTTTRRSPTCTRPSRPTATSSAARRSRCTSTACCPTWPSRRATFRCSARTTSRPARSVRSRLRPIPGILDDLNHLALEYRWVTRFVFLDKEEAQKELEKLSQAVVPEAEEPPLAAQGRRHRSRRARSSTAPRSRSPPTLTPRCRSSATTPSSFGYFTATVTVWDQDLEQARRKMQVVTQAIQSRGFVVRDETLNSRDAWLGTLPGHVYANVRRPIVHTINLAHLMPVSAVWAGDQENEHLTAVSGVGDAHVTCTTTGDTPVSPEPRRSGRRPHAHRRAHRRGQEHLARAARDAVAALPAARR